MGHLLGSFVVGLMATTSKRSYATHCLFQVCCSQSPCAYGRPLLTCASAGETQRQVWLNLSWVSGSWNVQGFVWALWAFLVDTGFVSECNFAPPTVLLDFSFALGCEVSFFGRIQHSPVNGCSAVSCYFGVQYWFLRSLAMLPSCLSG